MDRRSREGMIVSLVIRLTITVQLRCFSSREEIQGIKKVWGWEQSYDLRKKEYEILDVCGNPNLSNLVFAVPRFENALICKCGIKETE